jgi:cell division protein FtsN
MSSAFQKFVWGLVVVGALAAGYWAWKSCGKKPEKKPMQTLLQPDTTVQDFPPVEQPQTQQDQVKPQITTTEDGRYTVQVSSWRTQYKAEQDAQRYLSAGFDAYIQRAYVPEKDGTWYRVRVGRFATAGEAEQMAFRLAGLLESGFWVDRMRQEEK